MTDAAHPTDELWQLYASASLDAVASASLDRHLAECAACRVRLNAVVAAADAASLDLNWFGVTAELDAPPHGIIERALVRVGVSAETVRLMVATPSLRRSWYLAIVAVLLFGVAAASPDRPDSTILWFLALAPVIPVIGVALAYGPGVDPSYDVSVATPMSGFRLLLVRCLAVLSATAIIGGLVSLLLLRQHDVMVGAWLLPALALSGVCLVLMSVLPSRVAATVVSVGWLLVIIGSNRRAVDQLVLFRPPMQVVYAVVAIAAGTLLYLRRDAFETTNDAEAGSL